MSNTTKTQIADEVNYVYNRTLLQAARPFLTHTKWAQIRDIPANSGTASIRFSRYSLLSANTTALSEGVTPSGSQLTRTFVNATALQYGDFITITDKVLMETLDPILTETSKLLGQQAGNSIDQLTRTVLAAGTTIQYASTATATNEITANMPISKAEIMEAVRTLQGNNAQKMTSMIDPKTGYNSSPIPPCFVGIVSEDTLYDLKLITTFIPVEKYASKEGLMEGEVGALDEVRFVMTTNAYVNSAAGANSNDVHYTIILAGDAYGITRISGKALENIVKPLGSAGTGDPLDQRSTSSWKATFVAKILNEDFLLVLQHGVTA
jgi:N4-gp56 family major capsid protein